MTLSIRKIKISILAIFLATIVSPWSADAAILQPSYTIPSSVFSSSVNGQTGVVTLTGVVTAIAGQQPQNALLRYKTNIVGQPTVTEWPTFNPMAGGSFERTMSGMTCGQTYRFFLYEIENPNISGLTESLISWGNSPGFDHQISCGTAQTVGGDVMAPQSAGAEAIAGVNWGTIVSTDSSISFNNAHLIPVPPPVQNLVYQIEYGYGTPGQPNGTYSYLGDAGGTLSTNQPNYGFNRTISGLMPNTDYYFTIVEVVNGVETNLLTYALAPTNLLIGQGLNVNPSANSVIISGQLQTSNGNILYNTPIGIVIKDQGGQTLMTNTSITSPQSTFGSGGNFQSVFNDIANSGLVPGQTYTYTITNPDSIPQTGTDMTVPISFTIPTANTPPSSTATITGPDYAGLVACGMDPNMVYDCNFNTFLETVNRVVNFLILFIAFPCVALVIAWAGVLMLISGGSSQSRNQAKDMIGKVFVGLIVALLAWVIIKLVLVVFGYTPTGPLWQILGTTP